MKSLLLLTVFVLYLVGCSESTNESHVFIIETIQNDCEETYFEGEEEIAQMKEQLLDKSQSKEFLTKLKKAYSSIQETNLNCASEIAYLEELKLKLSHNQAKSALINHLEPCKPNSIDLKGFKTSDDIRVFTEASSEIHEHIYQFRRNLCRIIANSATSTGERNHFFNDPNIRQFKDKKELEMQLDAALKNSNVACDDAETLKQLYISLSINQYHWEAIFKDVKTNEEALAVLLSLEKTILNARLNTFKLVRSRFCFSTFNFTTIQPVINGANSAQAGETVQLEVFVAGFNENSPLELDQLKGGKLIKIENGKAYIQVLVENKKESIIRGNLLVRNKSGIVKTLPWEHRLKITN